MAIPLSELNFDKAVGYHYDKFPPTSLDYGALMGPVTKAVDAIARFDQMLKNMHNSEFLLAPLRQQEAVISSRMEGTVSTMDEILMYEAEYNEADEAEIKSANVRSEIIETILYERALTSAQKELESGRQISEWLIRSMHAKLLSFGRGAETRARSFRCAENDGVDQVRCLAANGRRQQGHARQQAPAPVFHRHQVGDLLAQPPQLVTGGGLLVAQRFNGSLQLADDKGGFVHGLGSFPARGKSAALARSTGAGLVVVGRVVVGHQTGRRRQRSQLYFLTVTVEPATSTRPCSFQSPEGEAPATSVPDTR